MDKEELLFAIKSNKYYMTERSSNHPSIVNARKKNVRLNFTRCHEIYDGSSYFIDPVQEEFYLKHNSKSLPSKSHMDKSSITDATSIGENHKFTDLGALLNKHREKRNNMAKSLHGEFQPATKNLEQSARKASGNKYEYQETSQMKFGNSFEDFRSFNSLTLSKTAQKQKNLKSCNGPKTSPKTFRDIMGEERLNNSIHLDDSGAPSDYPLSERKDSEASALFSVAKSYTSDAIKEDEEWATTFGDQTKPIQPFSPSRSSSEKYSRVGERSSHFRHGSSRTNFEVICETPENQLAEIEALKKKLAEKEEELKKCHETLKKTYNREKQLQTQIQKMKSKGIKRRPSFEKGSVITVGSTMRSYDGIKSYQDSKAGEEMRRELGGPMQAVLYFTLFMVLLSKSELRGQQQ